MTEELNKYRAKIDEIDKELVRLLAERFASVKKIGEVKKTVQIDVVQNQRWKKVLENISCLSKQYDVSEEFLVKVWNLIHEEAIRVEKQIVDE